MPRTSAGLLPFRISDSGLAEVLIVHPGGPFWARKDEGAWSIPKGEFDPESEEPLAVAEREFREELGSAAPSGERIDLGEVRQSGGKRVVAWAVEGQDFDPGTIVSNTFEMEWPPRSGSMGTFPEVDRAEWCSTTVARAKLLEGQVPFVDRLIAELRARGLFVRDSGQPPG